MSSNFPPGVSGNEYEIAGSDSEEEVECPKCNQIAIKQYYSVSWWIDCDECGFHEEGYIEDDMIDYYFELSQDR